MTSSKTRRSVGATVAQLLVLMLIALAYTVSPFTSSARAMAPQDIWGTWQGVGVDAPPIVQPPFPMTLIIAPGVANTFAGTLTEETYQTTVSVNGAFFGPIVTFTSNSYLSGNDMILHCVYTANVTIGGSQMQGVWNCPGGANGNFSLNRQ